MSKLTKTVSLLLALMIAAPLSSCSEPAAAEETTAYESTVSAETVIEEELDLTKAEERQRLSDNLPVKDFEGRSYRIGAYTELEYEFAVDDLTGEVTNDVIYDRNIRVEDRFNIKIETVDFTSDMANETVNLVLAGDDAFDIAGHWTYRVYIPIGAGIYQNWNDIGYVDFARPWWNQYANEAATVNGKLFNATGDLCITTLLYTYGIFFNDRLAEEFGYPAADLYNTVYDGKWTVDYLTQIVSEMYIDENGNGAKDETDTYGFAAFPLNTADIWPASFGISLCSKDDDGVPQVNPVTEKMTGALEKVIALYGTEGSLIPSDWFEEIDLFANEGVAFVPSCFEDAFGKYRFMSDSYGILPIPKFDEEQTEYLTNSKDQYTTLGVPMTAVDTDFIGIITEALAAESYKYVYPEYYDTALKSKYSQDADTSEMIDIIMAGRNYDFAFMFGQMINDLPWIFRTQLQAANSNIASKYASQQKSMNKNMDKVMKYYYGD